MSYDEYYNQILVKKDMQDWLKRLRQNIRPFKIRYFLVGEYGGETQRPHYHVILFNFPLDLDLDRVLTETWTFGLYHIGTVTPASIHYCSKYSLDSSILSNHLSWIFSQSL